MLKLVIAKVGSEEQLQRWPLGASRVAPWAS